MKPVSLCYRSSPLFWMQVVQEMSQLDIPVFVHEILHLQENMTREKCPVFNPHEESDPNNDELLIPSGELFVRQDVDLLWHTFNMSF